MASQHIQEEFAQGEDVDFDQLNENRLRSNFATDDIDKLLNPEIDIRNLNTGLSSPTKENRGVQKKVEPISLRELPNEKLNRLRREVQELKEELNVIIEREKDIKITNPSTQVALLKEIEAMQGQLSNIYQNEALAKGKQEGGNANETDKAFLGLKDNIKNYKAEALLAKLRDLQKTGNNSNENIIFQIKAKGLQEDDFNKIVEGLESRLAKLEISLEGSRLRNLIEEVQKVKKNVDLVLSSSDLSTKRLDQISLELENLNQKRQLLEWNDPRLIKVEKMHEAFQKLQRIGEHLPSLINRFECIKMIHEESVGITEKIENIKQNEKKISNALGEGSVLLKQVSDTLNENLPRIINEINELQKRL